MGRGRLQLAGGVPRAPRAEPRLMHGWCPERRSRGCQGRGLPQNRRACPPSCPHPSLPVLSSVPNPAEVGRGAEHGGPLSRLMALLK